MYRIIFMGSPDFAVPALQYLIESDHDVVGVYSQPPKPAGRGNTEHKTSVHLLAEKNNLPVFTPKSFKKEDAINQFQSLNADLAIVAAYGLILPQKILDMPTYGCWNLHASILPRWRGASPIQQAILYGDQKSGITLMQMDAGLDTGDMLLTEEIDITQTMTAQDLHDTLGALGPKILENGLTQLQAGTLQPTPQPDIGVTHAGKLSREDGGLDFTQNAQDLDYKIRAFTPWPGTWFKLNDEVIKVISATQTDLSGQPGEILDDDFTVACGTDALRLDKIQRPNRKSMSGSECLRGLRLKAGDKI